MRSPFLPLLLLLLLSAVLLLLPDGAFFVVRLHITSLVTRLWIDETHQTHPVLPEDSSQALREVIIQKNAEIADMRALLRNIGIAREFVPDTSVISARVISFGSDGSMDLFFIDAGSESGIIPGHAVAVGGSLAGIVARCDERTALVQSLSSSGCYIPARFIPPEDTAFKDRVIGAVHGVETGRVGALVFSPMTAAGPQWTAITTNLDSRVPEGLLIGSIAGGFSEGSENGTLEAVLIPALDLMSLDHVVVFVPMRTDGGSL